MRMDCISVVLGISRQMDFVERGAISVEFSSGFTWTICFPLKKEERLYINFNVLSKQDRESPQQGGFGGDWSTHFAMGRCHKITRSTKEQNQVLLAGYTSPPPGARPLRFPPSLQQPLPNLETRVRACVRTTDSSTRYV